MPLVQTRGAASAQGFGEFAQAAPAANYIEDVFSTYLYTGNTPSTNTIVNGIDLATKGGMVWTKTRSTVNSNTVWDTARGVKNLLITNQTAANLNIPVVYPSFPDYGLQSFNTTGFTLGKDWEGENQNGVTECSWTFRKQAKFFDIVTYTGNATARTIAHNLGSVPGCMFVKRTSTAKDWAVYHRSTGNTKYLALNSTQAESTAVDYWNNTTPTSTVFTVGIDGDVNANGETYVAYLFAHDAGGFGTAGTDNVISCGSFTGSSTSADITLGYEPQWILYKQSNGVAQWNIVDNMRGLPATPASGNYARGLFPNTSGAEDNRDDIAPTATGFKTLSNSASNTYIYIAIRRGPMKTPTSGTSVFEPTVRTGTGTSNQSISGLAFPPDLVITRNRPSNLNDKSVVFDKLRGPTKYLITSGSDDEATGATSLTSFNQTGETFGDAGIVNGNGDSYINWQFRRAPGFFDVVCYTGTGANRTVAHNLGVAPELWIVKGRNAGGETWNVGSTALAATERIILASTAAKDTVSTMWNSTYPTSAVFSVGTAGGSNANTYLYVAYLFATVAGVSKVGSYTGTGTTQTINCGFTAGARWVMIKRTDSTGDWYVWDSARGINPGNDPYLLLNSTAAEVTNTDYVDTASSGFEISSTAPAAINANGGSFIFLAIA
jgi:hypothetical protein